MERRRVRKVGGNGAQRNVRPLCSAAAKCSTAPHATGPAQIRFAFLFFLIYNFSKPVTTSYWLSYFLKYNQMLIVTREFLKKICEFTKSGLTTEVKKLRTDYIFKQEFEHLLAALMPENRLALEVSLATGLRISDVLSIKTSQLSADRRLTVKELKTGKTRRVLLPVELFERMHVYAGRYYIFEHRLDTKRHRTRQAVFKDLKRIAKIFKIQANIAPHTARKVWAVGQFKKFGDLKRVQRLLNHSDEAVTMIYAFADVMVKRKLPKIDALIAKQAISNP